MMPWGLCLFTHSGCQQGPWEGAHVSAVLSLPSPRPALFSLFPCSCTSECFWVVPESFPGLSQTPFKM